MMDDTFQLTDGERHSALWARLMGHFETELKNTRGRNDGPLDAVATADMRGQIKVWKGLLALNEQD